MPDRTDPQPLPPEGSATIGFWGATSIGIGGMVGGGIFAVLGLAVVMAGSGAPLSFLLAGGVALLTASSYVSLTVAYPSRGGTVIFVDRAFGVDVVTGSLNTLLWLSYIVTLSLYAVAFANYAAALIGNDAGWLWHVLVSGGIVGPAALNLKGASLMSRAETLVVGVKVAILLLVGVVGLSAVQVSRVEPAAWGPLGGVVSAGMLMFVAYEGFELIANAAPDVRTPSRTIPRAYYTSVGFVTALYVLIAVVTVGALAPADIQGASDFVLAAAARPSLGALGFTLVSVSALLATFSAINATLFGSARLSATIAEEGELPSVLARRVWNQPVVGLLLTTSGALMLSNTADIESISMMASAGFLVIFASVNAAAVVLSGETGGRRWLAGAGVAACLAAVGALVWHTAQTSPGQLLVLASLVGTAVGVEVGMMAVGRSTTRAPKR